MPDSLINVLYYTATLLTPRTAAIDAQKRSFKMWYFIWLNGYRKR